LTAPARLNLISHGPKKPEIALSPNGTHRNAAVPAANRAFVLPPRYGMAIVEIRGVSQRIPTHSCVQRAPGYPIHVCFAAIPGFRIAHPGISLE